MEYTICRGGNKHFDIHLRRIRSVHFLSKDGKGASYEGRNGWKSCLFLARVGISDFDVIIWKVLFPILYLDLACKQLCFPPGKAVNRRNESADLEFLEPFHHSVVLMMIPSIVTSLRCIIRNC